MRKNDVLLCTLWMYDNNVLILDIDECSEKKDNCSDPSRANCTNIPGGFNCEYLPGYKGDGFHCERTLSSF